MKSLPRPLVYLLLSAYCTAPLTVQAADDGERVTVQANRDGDLLVDKSTVGAKFPTPARDIPQQLTVISQDLIATQADISLYRALDNVPGIVITPSADTATGNNI